MRQILFKAKRLDNGEWVEGGYVNKTDYYGIECDEHYIIDGTVTDMEGYGEHYLVDKDTICQYTGLPDKNGNKIWENDVLKGGLVVTWEKEFASFCLSRKGWAFRHFFGEAVNGCDCEAIGNIFDNPELIGE